MRAGSRILGHWAAGLLLAGSANATTVAVIDSGLDTEHDELLAKVWLNAQDAEADGIDQDQNGYQDDQHGWNFANNNNKLIDRSFNDLYNADIARFFEIQAAGLLGKASDDDKAWVKEKAGDKAFIKRLSTYGNYAHGTHVSGIVAGQTSDSKVIGIKLIPTKNPLQQLAVDVEKDVKAGKDVNWILRQTIKGGLILFAKLQAQAFKPIGAYVHGHQAGVANGSFGIGAAQARMLLTPVLKLALRGQEPSAKSLDELTRFFLQQLVHEQQILLRQAPETLFVFAAGNDGSNNDEFPAAPATIQHPHVISVAASFANGTLAPFSNFGQSSVDLAAPGVSIESQVPDQLRLKLSGTSQASPHVAGTAAEVLAINPALTPSDVKILIVQTVDVLPELKDKVRSSGVLNHRRAIEAAHLSLAKPLAVAISEAKKTIADGIERSLVSPSEDAPAYFNIMPALLSQ